MHSSKNTIVAILLMGISYGVYQVMTAPVSPLSGNSEATALDGLDAADSKTEPRPEPTHRAGDSLPIAISQGPAPKRLKNDDAASDQEEFSLPELPSLSFTSPNDVPTATAATPREPSRSAVDAGSTASSDFSIDTPPSRSTATPAPSGTGSQFQGMTPSPSTQMSPLSRDSGNSTGFSGLESSEPAAREVVVPGRSPQYTNVASPSTASNPAPSVPLSDMWVTVRAHVATGKHREALAALTPYCNDRSLNDSDREQVLTWLDALASKVIYSGEHLLVSEAYVVKPSDTLETIATEWQVPFQLIYNINSAKIPRPLELAAGTSLKKIEGPFDAIVDLQQNELTLMLGSLYAGRFQILSASPQVAPGQFRVASKNPKDPSAGEFAMTLESGAVLNAEGSAPNATGISFASADAKDLYGILSVGSRITIR
jgi:hypothetical protein